MPFTVGWYDAGLLVDCTGPLGIDATDELVKTVIAALDPLERPTSLILDWRSIQGDPYHCHLCTKQVVALTHQHLGQVAAVAGVSVVSLWLDLIGNEPQHRYLACTALEEAVLLLEHLALPYHDQP